MLFHSFGCAWSEVQIRTVLSCDADAIYDLDSKVGAHATSRTQSLWPERVVVRTYVLSVGLFVGELAKQVSREGRMRSMEDGRHRRREGEEEKDRNAEV